MADNYTPLPVKSKNTNDLSVQLRNPANSAFMGDATTPLVTTVNNASLAVTGTFWQATQPVSGTITANQGTAAAGSSAWPTTTVDTSNTIVKPGDATNNAVRVNVVAGSTGGSSAPTTPTHSYLTISALAISTRTAMNFTEIGTSLTARLSQLDTASTVTCKWELFTVTNGTESGAPIAIFFSTASNAVLSWTPPHPNYVTIAASAGADNFRLYVTNLDPALAADVYATAFWDIS